MKFSEKSILIDDIFDWLETLVLYCFIALLLLTFVFKLVVVDGNSMNPTLVDGQRLITTNVFYTPKYGDIVIFQNTEAINKKVLIKRVIATEGQTVSIDFDKGEVKVDGKVLDEPYIKELTTNRLDFYQNEVVVPEGCVFVMGDNRNNSTDSRSNMVGMVPTDTIIGKVVLRLSPFSFF